MKIFGIGTDIVQVNRFKKTLKRRALLKRIFNKDEISKCQRNVKYPNCFAKRFAAKEAFSKALGTGVSKGISFNEIIVMRETIIKQISSKLIFLFLSNLIKKYKKIR